MARKIKRLRTKDKTQSVGAASTPQTEAQGQSDDASDLSVAQDPAGAPPAGLEAVESIDADADADVDAEAVEILDASEAAESIDAEVVEVVGTVEAPVPAESQMSAEAAESREAAESGEAAGSGEALEAPEVAEPADAVQSLDTTTLAEESSEASSEGTTAADATSSEPPVVGASEATAESDELADLIAEAEAAGPLETEPGQAEPVAPEPVPTESLDSDPVTVEPAPVESSAPEPMPAEAPTSQPDAVHRASERDDRDLPSVEAASAGTGDADGAAPPQPEETDGTVVTGDAEGIEDTEASGDTDASGNTESSHIFEIPVGESPAAAASTGPASDDVAGPGAETVAPAPGPVGRPAEGKAAWRRLLRMGLPRATKANVLAALLAVLLGLAIATQVQLTQERGLSELSQTDLIRVLDDVSARSSRLDDQIRELEVTRDRLKSGAGSSAEALAQAQKRADTLGILAGTVGATGPGVVIRVADPAKAVSGPIVLDLIQELRDAGAEAIDVGGVRVVASSFVGEADGVITIDGVRIARPITVKAIGEPKTLSSAMTIPGGIVETVRQKNATATVTEESKIEITSIHNARMPRSATVTP